MRRERRTRRDCIIEYHAAQSQTGQTAPEVVACQA